MQKLGKNPISGLYPHRSKIGGSIGSLSSSSIVSPISSEGVLDDVSYYNNLISGRSLDQLHKSSIETDYDVPEHRNLQQKVEELLLRLKDSEKEKENIISDYEKKVSSIQNAANERFEAAKESQAKQAHLVERLQGKVAYYKDQCTLMEARLLEVNGLSNESQYRLTETSKVLEGLEEKLRITEDRHNEEIKQWQVKLEEQEENNNTLVQVNASLRMQLESATRKGDKLLSEIDILTENWDKLNKELNEKQNSTPPTVDLKIEDLCTGDRIRHMWAEIITFRRQFNNMKGYTKKNLAELKSELSSTGRELLSACESVQAKSNFIAVDQNDSRLLHVGSQKDLWRKLQESKYERDALSEKIQTVTSDNKQLSRELSKHQRLLTSLEETNVDLASENNLLRSQSHPILKVTSEKHLELERDKIRLERSISNIANQAIADMNEEQDVALSFGDIEHEIKESIRPSETNNTFAVKNSGINSDIPAKSKYKGHRRTRSMSPSAARSSQDSVTTVQNVLNQRQIQVHGLKTKLALSTKRIDQLTNTFTNKHTRAVDIEKQLEAEKEICDSLKIELDRGKQEKLSLQEKISSIQTEKSNLLMSKEKLQNELESSLKINATLKDQLITEIAKLKEVSQDNRKSSKDFDILKRNFEEKISTIKSLEASILKLKDELLIEKESNGTIKNDLKLSQMKNETYELKLQESEGATTKEYDLEIQRLKERRTSLEENCQRLESSHSFITSKAREYEKEIERLKTEELFELRLKLEEAQSHADELNEQLVKVKAQHDVALKEKTEIRSNLHEERLMKEKLDIENISIMNKNNENEKLLEALKYEKDALMDDLSNSNQESYNLKHQIDIVSAQNSEMSTKIKELSTQVDGLTQQLHQAETTYKSILLDTNEENQETIQVLQSELADFEKIVNSLNNEKEELTKKLNRSNIQLKSNKLSLEEEILKNNSNQTKFETEIEESKAQFMKTISQLKKELEDAEDYRSNELEENRKNLEKIHKGEIVRLSQEKAVQIENLRTDVKNLSEELIKERKIHTEEQLLQESSKEQSLRIAKQELNLIIEQNNELSEQLKGATKENEALKSQFSTRGEADRNLVTSIKLENSRIKFQIEKMQEQFDSDKLNLKELCSIEKAQKEEMEQEVQKLMHDITIYNEKIESLTEELEKTNVKLLEYESEKNLKNSKEFENLEKSLLESKNCIQRLERNKQALTDHNHVLELEKIENVNKIQALEKSSDCFERELGLKRKQIREAKDDYIELKEKFDVIENTATEQKNEISVLKSDYQKLVEDHTKLLRKDDLQLNYNENESNKATELNYQILELQSSKAALEKELIVKSTVLTEEEKKSSENQIMIQQNLNKEIEKNKMLEHKMNSQDILLSESREEIKHLSSMLRSEEARFKEIQLRLKLQETELLEKDSKIHSVAMILQQVRTAHSHSRSSTPTRRTVLAPSTSASLSNRRSRLTSGETSGIATDNSFRHSQEFNYNNDIIDKAKSYARELVSKMAMSEKEIEDLRHTIAELKIQNDGLLSNTATLEEQISRAKLKMKGSEEQQKKLESKISNGDISLATQDETLKRVEQESRQLLRKLGNATRQLEDSENNRLILENEVKKIKESESKLDAEIRQIKQEYQNSKIENSKYEVQRQVLETEQKRLNSIISEKDGQMKTLRSKCDKLSRDNSSLENKCSSLDHTISNLNSKLDEANATDTYTINDTRQIRANDEQKTFNEADIRRLERLLQASQSEKNLFEKKLNSLKDNFDRLSASRDQAEKTIHGLQDDLQRSESKLNAKNIELYNTKLALESNTQDDVIRNELVRVRKEKETLYNQLQDACTKLAIAEADKSELERKLIKQKSKISTTAKEMLHQVDHVRTQIPLVAAGAYEPKHGAQSGNHLNHHHILKVKIAEQETERQRKKVKALEEQLLSLEKLQTERMNDLLFERQKEKEKELKRHKIEVLRCQEALLAKERIYKERINGLEKQIATLRDQLDKELKRRKIFISNTAGLNNDISHIRSNLDESLQNITSSSYNYHTSAELGKTLDRESTKLHELSQHFKNSPSKRAEIRSQKIHTDRPITTAKRTLSFENIVT